MTTTLRDLMLVCRNGHVITDRLKARPDLRLPRCDRCGADTLDRCETCGHLFAGANPVPGFEPIGFAPVPATCTTCGATFPWAISDIGPADELLDRLTHLLKRLPRVARELRLQPGCPNAIRCERDLDDLVRSLLPIHFDDVRPESRTPRYSDGNRTAFLLPEIATVVVPHFVVAGMNDLELQQRREWDVNEYASRAGLGSLLLFIYDPERRLPGPEKLAAAWSRNVGKLGVRCVIAG